MHGSGLSQSVFQPTSGRGETMYLHVGNNKTIRLRNVVGIFDADSATVSAEKKKYLLRAEAERRVQFAAMELPKSFVL